MLTRICVVAAAVVALAAACEDSSSTPGDDRQAVAGSEIRYHTEDGHENAITDPVVLSSLQQKLGREGLYHGPATGLSSSELARGLRNYRQQHHLGESAVIDHATSDKLGLDWSQVSAGASVKKELENVGEKVKEGAERLGQKVEDTAHDVSQDPKKK